MADEMKHLPLRRIVEGWVPGPGLASWWEKEGWR